MKSRGHDWESWPVYSLGPNKVPEVRTAVRCRACGAERKKGKPAAGCPGAGR